MEANIDSDNRPVENSNNHNSDKITDVNYPTTDTNYTISNQEIEDTDQMNKNPKHLFGKKGWRYLFEFLMLFLAVFCGFLAENFRVQLSENNREKEYIHSIIEDIKSDTLESSLTLTQLNSIKTGIDSVLILLASPDVIENSNEHTCYGQKIWDWKFLFRTTEPFNN